jgi:hypothetical protein
MCLWSGCKQRFSHHGFAWVLIAAALLHQATSSCSYALVSDLAMPEPFVIRVYRLQITTDWVTRHQLWDDLKACNPHHKMHRVAKLFSPDELLYGRSTGARAPAVIPLPDIPRKKQTTLERFGFMSMPKPKKYRQTSLKEFGFGS